ncbi:hypothetical protein [Streptomyces sp. BK239]|uniref:hypothetical protein n=1 Tax=Streptomyces sp. BK239 TaxID=2512155 RepID=UPI00102AD9EC|nr:hypothetical protein [Streptomyces sp. BK239]RZU24718.1 hypothetical protein EV567_0177 [Streptomyces sp. BK239]
MATYTPRFPGRGTLVEEAMSEGEAKGEAKGRAADILRILDRRGIEVSEAVRESVTSCTDLDALGTWLDRSLTASAAEELFDGA